MVAALPGPLRTSTDERITTIWLDAPDKSVNTNTPRLFADLDAVLAELESSPPAGLIIASAKPTSFSAGADLFALAKMDPQELRQYLGLGQRVLDRLARLPCTTVAAIRGDALGGGLELALACTYRVAADLPAISLGLPEVRLGLLPAWGGTTRLPRLIGLRRALPLLLTGSTLSPQQALSIGLLDRVAPADDLIPACRQLVAAAPPRRGRGRDFSRIESALASSSRLRNRFLDRARQRTLEKTHGNYPAPLRLIEVVRKGYDDGCEAGLRAACAALVELTQTDPCRNLLRLFFLRQGARKRALAQCRGATPAEVRRVGIVGGGIMGSGIAHALLRCGYSVILVEADEPAKAAAAERVAKLLASTDNSAALPALVPTTSWDALRDTDLIIEAIYEDPEAKRQVFARLDETAQPSAILASNTSSLSIASLASATTHPHRVLGMHFFNPVPKMPLVEIVRTPFTESGALATVVALVGRLGKTPVVVNDSPGFVVNRVLFPYLSEALTMASEGVPIDIIDDAMRRWGMPMGPFQLMDEIGLDVAACILRSLEQSVLEPHPAAAATLDGAVAAGCLGRKTSRGFYLHPAGRAKAPLVNDALEAITSPSPAAQRLIPPPKEIQHRLLAPMLAHARRLLDEQVVDDPAPIDLATVLGLGLAPFRGGLATYAGLSSAPSPLPATAP